MNKNFQTPNQDFQAQVPMSAPPAMQVFAQYVWLIRKILESSETAEAKCARIEALLPMITPSVKPNSPR